LARGVSERVGGRVLTGEAEEVDLPGIWVPLDEAANLVVAGKISNAIAMIGILTTARLRQEGWKSLRSADEPWVARDRLLTLDRVRSGRFEHG
jgi:ADP-ribose pyrophosphatase